MAFTAGSAWPRALRLQPELQEGVSLHVETIIVQA
jgi:hypothetical protein